MSSAVISDCGNYRYVLTRDIPQIVRWVKPCLFVMLNPSVANAHIDDPTIKRCKGFAASWGCTSLTVVNLFAYRATDPKQMEKMYEDGYDIEGPDNLTHIKEQLQEHALGVVVVAWGSNPLCRMQTAHHDWLIKAGAKCLAINKGGSPKHPLYVKADTQLVTWNGYP